MVGIQGATRGATRGGVGLQSGRGAGGLGRQGATGGVHG